MTTLKAEKRSMDVKAKRLRREGYVTGNVFGKKIQGSIPVKMEKKDVDRLLKTETKGGQIMLDVEGEVYDVLIKEVDYDAMANQVVEIDFQALVSNEKVHSVAEIIFENHDKVEAGVLQEVLKEVSHYRLHWLRKSKLMLVRWRLVIRFVSKTFRSQKIKTLIF